MEAASSFKSLGLLDRLGIDSMIVAVRPSGKESTLKVSVENVPKVDLGNNGILIRIRDEDGTNLGKLWIGQAHVRWARGSVPESNAKRLPIRQFVDFLNDLSN